MNVRYAVSLLWIILILILGVRLAGLGLYPLMDSSEARYGEIARKMIEFDDWITPMFDKGVPFWGKPPLALWSQALSMKVLGVSEFAARLPAWLFHVASCLLIVQLGSRTFEKKVGLLAAIIYSSCTSGLLMSGAVLTDPAFGLALLLAYGGFWFAMHGDRNAAYLGFLGLGLGLLAKGPVTLVLLAIPLVAWLAFFQRWKCLRHLPWLSGLAIVALVAAPWYALAELKTPGFLDYFVFNEHWKRYVITDWTGALYGDVHSQPLGTIWLYLLGALFPWSLLLPLLYWLRPSEKDSGFQGYLWCWALSTPLFFTLSGNILWTYVLPALPAWALLLAASIGRCRRAGPVAVCAFSLVMPLLGVMLVLNGSMTLGHQSQREIVQAWQRAKPERPGRLFYWHRRSFSAEFYSAGQARRIEELDQLPITAEFYLVRRLAELDTPLPRELQCTLMAQANASLLLRCRRQASPLVHSVRSGSFSA